jgi:hypothetical protein
MTRLIADSAARDGQQDPLAGQVDGVAAAHQRLIGQRWAHAGQEQALGQSAKRALTHERKV